MRDLTLLAKFRDVGAERRLYGVTGGSTEGCFVLRATPGGPALAVIASSGGGWDHISVSLGHRTPTWAEMEFVKRKFFDDTETAMQLHVPVAQHISYHPHCLHLWRPQTEIIPMPPAIFVGPPRQ